MSDVPLAGCRKAGGWPVTARTQAWLGLAASPLAAAGMLVASRGDPAVFGSGVGVSMLSAIPHEHLHAAAARALGLKARVRWSALMPQSQSEGVLRMYQIPLTSLAPQLLTLGLGISAVLSRSPVLAVAAIGHATISVGDYAHATYAAVASLRPQTRRRLLLNGPGPEAGLYEPAQAAVRQPERAEGRRVMQFRIYPDYWEMSAGPEPSLGPIEASDARSAYREARDKGMYPAGMTFGLRAVALDEYGRLAPERGVWGGTQETPEWAAYERSLALREEVRSTPRTSEESARTSATDEKEAHGHMKIEARNMKLLDNRTDNLHAICDVNLGGEFVIQGVRVVASKDGKPFVSLPAYQDRNGDYHEVAHPVTAKAREVTNQVVLKEFERQVLAKLPKAVGGPER